MTYIGKCPECGKRVALYVRTPWELQRHGHNPQGNSPVACLGSGTEPVFGTISYQPGGRPIEQESR